MPCDEMTCIKMIRMCMSLNNIFYHRQIHIILTHSTCRPGEHVHSFYAIHMYKYTYLGHDKALFPPYSHIIA
jgi:hypothetical protein